MLLLTISVILAITMTGASALLYRELRIVRGELDRTQQRMARLDELVDEFATREAHPSFVMLEAQLVEPSAEEFVAPSVPPIPEPRGLEFESEELIRETSAGRMTSQLPEDRRQKPSRKQHTTPVGSPKTFSSWSEDSVVAVGSIQVRSDELKRQ